MLVPVLAPSSAIGRSLVSRDGGDPSFVLVSIDMESSFRSSTAEVFCRACSAVSQASLISGSQF